MFADVLKIKKIVQLFAIFAMAVMLSACVGTVVGAAVDTAIEVIKVPFKVGGAVIDVVTPDDLTETLVEDHDKSFDSDQTAVEMESEGL